MPSSKPGSRLIKAAGGVAWRPGPDGEPEILLVHRKKYDDWSLPKGKTEPGEALPATAVREVREESGARLALGRRLNSVRYNVGGRPKRVHYWAAQVLSVDDRAVPNSEVDEVAWLPASRAVEKVSYAHDHGVLAEFAARPPGTVPLILLRHAKALSKHGWMHADIARPLEDAGRADAAAVAELLACFAARPRLVSSPAVRCLDTLAPLAERTGAPVREEPALYIHNPSSRTQAGDPGTSMTGIVRAAIAAGEPVVICAHRENIPVLGAGPRPPLDRMDALPQDWDSALPTSGFWVLNIVPPPASEPVNAGSAAAPAASRRWWQRLRVRSPQDPALLGGPVGVLVAADRYELPDGP
jgi:8-oxo-dGTP pyrophosphatase MutT (NUDIX family)/phosphohistidine phosphatase SixA